MSSDEIPLHIGLNGANIDSMLLVWPDNSFEKINWQADTQAIRTITYVGGLPSLIIPHFPDMIVMKPCLQKM
jgi:hypothetical protein